MVRLPLVMREPDGVVHAIYPNEKLHRALCWHLNEVVGDYGAVYKPAWPNCLHCVAMMLTGWQYATEPR